MIFKRKKNEVDNASLLRDIYTSKKLKRAFSFLLGIVLSAISFNLFLKPLHLITGVSGISVMTEKLYQMDPSIVIMVGNIILLVASSIFLGKDATKTALIGSILYPILVKATDFLPEMIDFGSTEVIVLTLFGSLISGIGTGLIFKNNYSSGGSDVVKQIFSKYGKMSYSKSSAYSEVLIMLCGGIVFGWEAFIYSLVYLVVSGSVSDRVIMGISEYKTLQIVTDKEEEIKDFIMKNLNHGITEIKAKGGYTNDNKKMLLCAVPTRQYFLATEGIKKLDPEAFVIAIDTYEIQGRE